MYFIKKSFNLKSINAFIRLYSLARKNHYDVLKLRKNCTDKEIKDAYIQMSKEYHPDKNKDAKAQEKFVRIAEAYNVLGKPSSRAAYDHMTEISTGGGGASYVYRTHVPYNLRNNPNYSYYYESTAHKTHTTGQKSNQGYYGFEGVKKLPHYYIICICLGITFAGVVLQLYVIRNMYAIQRSRAQEKTKRLADEIDKVRAAARDNGNELQTRLLLDKIVTASNPTVTTASLGQALANENKVNSKLLTEFGISEVNDEWYEMKDDFNFNLCDVISHVMSYLY